MATHSNHFVYFLILICFFSCDIRQPDLVVESVLTPPVIVPEQIKETDREKVQKTFIAEIGVTEKGGNNKGPRIKEYLASTDLKEGYPWCAAFVKWSFVQNGIDTPGASAWSPSWFPTTRVINKKGQGRDPQVSDVFGLYYPNLGRVGHAGFVDEFHGDYIITVEGNTNAGGVRDGDGVHRKRRLMRQVHVVSDWIAKP